MSAPSMPPDNSASIRQMELQAQREAQEKADRAAEARKQELAGLRATAGSTGRQSAMDYFTQQGVDPSMYASDIDAQINAILGGIAPEDPNPGSYFNNVGASTYGKVQDSARAKADRQLNTYFAPNFETSRVNMELDDPFLASIEAEQRSAADEIIRNMLSRGVITDTGYSAALKDIDRQTPGVKSRLNEIGTTSLTAEQEALRGIANKGRQTAANLTLGSVFDPLTYSSEADRHFENFFNNLGTDLRGKVPGNLFNTTGLGAIAGASQGAQNLPFDPAAVAGLPTDDEEKNSTKKEAIF